MEAIFDVSKDAEVKELITSGEAKFKTQIAQKKAIEEKYEQDMNALFGEMEKLHDEVWTGVIEKLKAAGIDFSEEDAKHLTYNPDDNMIYKRSDEECPDCNPNMVRGRGAAVEEFVQDLMKALKQKAEAAGELPPNKEKLN